ncbi:hypothetical protein S40288_09384 [Stachybotrys chartarum IBT 40288]|nr:hypothetical protein S40288_09384 [Stachybotrys chartarum IBT 40288]
MSYQSLVSWAMASMSIGTAFAWLGATSLLWYFASGAYFAFCHPLAKIPGPRLHAISQLPYLYHLVRGDWHQVLKQLHDQDGPAVRFTYNDVSFITAESFKTIYGHKNGWQKTFEKRIRRDTSIDQVDHIIDASNEDHKRMRRLLSHAFSDKALRNQEDILQFYVDKFIEKLSERARKAVVVDIVEWYNFATFDLIGDLAFGQPFGCLESGGYHPWVQMIFQSVKLFPFQEVAARLGVQRLAPLLTPGHVKRGARDQHLLSQQTAMRRLESRNTDREDFMSYFLRHNENKGGLSVPEIVGNSSILIIAGSETTATLLSGTTFQHLKNPAVHKRLVTEIRSSFNSAQEITVERVGQLQYVLAVFNEGFRMYPPVPSSLPRYQYLTGQHSRARTIFAIQRNFARNGGFMIQSMLATQGRSYSPSLWAHATELARSKFIRETSRRCHCGKRPFETDRIPHVNGLAYAEMQLILVRLLWKFDIEMMPEIRDWDKQGVYVLWEKGELKIKLTEFTK